VKRFPKKSASVSPGKALKKQYRKKDGMQMKRSKSSKKLMG